MGDVLTPHGVCDGIDDLVCVMMTMYACVLCVTCVCVMMMMICMYVICVCARACVVGVI